VYQRVRPQLFKLDPERAHRLTLGLLKLAGAMPPIRSGLRRIFSIPDPKLGVEAFGLRFANPIGLAAGYDKNGLAMHGLASLGFGHLEIGTVTLRAQGGNPRPRMFRLEEDQALINRLGFPNEGVRRLQSRLRHRPRDVVIGINIGKGTDTPLERAEHDYCFLIEQLHDQADYFAVNVSSPNTLGLRQLQGRRYLERLLASIGTIRAELEGAHDKRIPILVKLAPDLSHPELADAVAVISEAEMDGIIATNTTIRRAGLSSSYAEEDGGLSGRPLRDRATQVIREIDEICSGRLPIIGVGGIMGSEDARQKLEAGAALVQVYTGLVYRGPGLVREILQSLTA
jgi:dihydroorotate dehydrogenase